VSGSRTLKGRIALCALALAVVGLVAFPVIAQAVGVGIVDGTVTDASSGDPIGGVEVKLWDAVAEAETGISVYTDDGGYYSFPDIPAGTDYSVSFNDGRTVQRYDSAFYLNRTSIYTAEHLWVNDGETTTANQTLNYVEPNIIGHVKDSEGNGVPNVVVRVYLTNTDDLMSPDSTVYTDANGDYEIRFLSEGDSRYLGFFPSNEYEPFLSSVFYLDKSSLALSDAVTYDPMLDPMPVQDVTLPSKTPLITGQVTAADWGSGLSDKQMQVWWVSDQTGEWEQIAIPPVPDTLYTTGNWTDWDGNYAIYGIPDSGTDHHYYVRAFDPGGYFAPQYYDGVETSSTATEVTVEDGVTSTGIDFALDNLAPSVQGKVTEAGSGRPIRNCAVSAYQYNPELSDYPAEPTQSGWTNSLGEYEIYGLYDSTNGGFTDKPVKLVFNEWSSSRPAYSQSWYQNKTSLADATSVITTTGLTATANAVLTQRPVSIKGRLKGEFMPGERLFETSIYQIDMNIEVWDPIEKQWDGGEAAEVQQDGTYAFYDLPAGTYRLQVRDTGGHYFMQYYTGDLLELGTRDYNKQKSIAYTPASGTRVVNFKLTPAARSLAGTIIDDKTSAPIADAWAEVYKYYDSGEPGVPGEWNWEDNASTDAAGHYEMAGPVADAGLNPGGSPEPTATALVKIQFGEAQGRYASEYYDGQLNFDDADEVTLTFNSTYTADAALTKNAPAISGTVTTASGPAVGVSVAVYPDFGPGMWEAQYYATTDALGKYEVYIDGMDEVPTAGYVVAFTSWDNKYTDQIYNSLMLMDQQNPLFDVPSGTRVIWTPAAGPVTGINALLALNPLSMSGHVTNKNDGDPIKNMWVYAYSADPVENDGYSRYEAIASTDELGEYKFYGLQNGKDYKIAFTDEDGAGVGTSYLTQWYLNETDFWGDMPAIADESVGTVVNTAAPLTTIDASMILGEVVEPVAQSTVDPAYTAVAKFNITGIDPEPWGPRSASGIKNVSYLLDSTSASDDPTTTADGTTSVMVDDVRTLGEHTIEFWVEDWAGNESAHEIRKFTVNKAIAVRLTKTTRAENSVAVAKAANPTWSGVKDILLACADDRASADSLSAAGLSWAYTDPDVGATPPLFLIPSASTPTAVKQAVADIVKANGRVAVHVVGGTGSVPDARVSEIRAFVKTNRELTDAQLLRTLPIDRLTATGTRYDLAKVIALRMKALRGADMASFALIANGADAGTFFDALALGPIAAKKGAPILLVSKVSVPTATSSALSELGISGANTYIAGGTGTVPALIATRLRVPSANRLWGMTRYTTTLAIVNKAISMGWLDAKHIAIASTLPDALPAGVMVGGQGGILLITTASPLQANTKAWLIDKADKVQTCFVAGGLTAIPASTLNAINAALTVP